MSMGLRIKEERRRLGLNQEDFAAFVGTSKRSFISWEQDATSPNGKYLAAMAEHGADVQYILTGTRSVNMNSLESASEMPVTRRQAALLDNVAHCTQEDQDAIFRMASLAASSGTHKEEKKSA